MSTENQNHKIKFGRAAPGIPVTDIQRSLQPNFADSRVKHFTLKVSRIFQQIRDIFKVTRIC